MKDMVNLKIQENESLKVGFYRIFSELVRYSLDKLTNIEQYDYAIHEARKSFKRVRSLLRIFKPAIDELVFEEFNMLFRDLGRTLSQFRDLDSITECLSKIKPKNEIKNEIITTLKIQIDNMRFNNDIDQMNKAINEVIDNLNNALNNLNKIELPDDCKPYIKKGIKKIYDIGRSQYYKNLLETNDILMHEWRKKVKQLWDVSLIFNDGSPEDETYAEEIHTLSTLLGDYHDLVLTFEFVYNEQLILDEESFIKFKKILIKRKDKLARQSFEQAQNIYKLSVEEFIKNYSKNKLVRYL
jgi:CHAD domain-containing protein